MTTEGMTLFRNRGWGSALIEAQLAVYGMVAELVDAGDVLRDAAARARLEVVNPLAQIPTMVLPSGEVMTESAAMTLHLADLAGSHVLVPDAQAPERAAFLRWLVFLVANIYPCLTFADLPTRFVADAGAAQAFRDRVDAYQQGLWRQLEGEVAIRGGPWFLGGRFSALDLYVGVMANWRPGAEWFRKEAPCLWRIAEAVRARPDQAEVWAANFA